MSSKFIESLGCAHALGGGKFSKEMRVTLWKTLRQTTLRARKIDPWLSSFEKDQRSVPRTHKGRQLTTAWNFSSRASVGLWRYLHSCAHRHTHIQTYMKNKTKSLKGLESPAFVEHSRSARLSGEQLTYSMCNSHRLSSSRHSFFLSYGQGDRVAGDLWTWMGAPFVPEFRIWVCPLLTLGERVGYAYRVLNIFILSHPLRSGSC